MGPPCEYMPSPVVRLVHPASICPLPLSDWSFLHHCQAPPAPRRPFRGPPCSRSAALWTPGRTSTCARGTWSPGPPPSGMPPVWSPPSGAPPPYGHLPRVRPPYSHLPRVRSPCTVTSLGCAPPYGHLPRVRPTYEYKQTLTATYMSQPRTRGGGLYFAFVRPSARHSDTFV
eukprot:1183018-Prorocentrum_minimum.AAC.1